jgi:hypothetical protein
VYVVDNAGDDLAAVRHINACGGPDQHRAVLRPTPGARDVLTTGWDLLVAAGKPPHAARREHVSAQSWQYGQAWLAGSGVTDLVVDRAHLLTPGQADTAAAAAARAGATVWLLWGTGLDPYTPAYDSAPHLVAGTRTQVISLWEFYRRLPTAAPPAAEPSEPRDDWPPLPAADFPTFLAACRRYLPRPGLAQVARLYYDTAEAADAWLNTYGAARDPRDGQLTPGFEAALTGWLRDSAIGPAPCGPAALVRLRAVQAALFVRAIVLSWRPGPLGPQPAARLPGNLTAQVAGALQTAVRTDAAAATALSVHLNQGPAFFATVQIGDVFLARQRQQPLGLRHRPRPRCWLAVGHRRPPRGCCAPARSPEATLRRTSPALSPIRWPTSSSAATASCSWSIPAPTSWPMANALLLSVAFRVPSLDSRSSASWRRRPPIAYCVPLTACTGTGLGRACRSGSRRRLTQ